MRKSLFGNMLLCIRLWTTVFAQAALFIKGQKCLLLAQLNHQGG